VEFVAMLFIPVGCINVLFCAFAKPECVDARVVISDMVRINKPKAFALWRYSNILSENSNGNLIYMTTVYE